MGRHTGVIFLIPNCFEACVLAMVKHRWVIPRFVDSATNAGMASLPFVLVMLAAIVDRVSSGLGLRTWVQNTSPTGFMLGCMSVPYLGMQALASLKFGGGEYNYIYVLMLTLPLFLAAADTLVVRKVAITRAAYLLTVVAFVSLTALAARRSYSAWKSWNAETPRLAVAYPNAKALYSCFDYRLVHDCRWVPCSDLMTAWHYLNGGFHSADIFEALVNQEYDVVVFHDIFRAPEEERWNSVSFREYKDAVFRYYEPDNGSSIPDWLQGKLLVRRRLENHAPRINDVSK